MRRGAEDALDQQDVPPRRHPPVRAGRAKTASRCTRFGLPRKGFLRIKKCVGDPLRYYILCESFNRLAMER
ncbi:hypothetical protein EVAR_74567_1 [Eumeta japonica]|uniref:Uncharacterized protein n=1 Tax=Eumeta variegata TaxID=151549 RepID=A0A4C1TBQ8_EUMVA|nr:hypothetical protein EVAR_74567_1 [Eumeta japonica]